MKYNILYLDTFLNGSPCIYINLIAGTCSKYVLAISLRLKALQVLSEVRLNQI
jgi:DNA polymerase II large subunit